MCEHTFPIISKSPFPETQYSILYVLYCSTSYKQIESVLLLNVFICNYIYIENANSSILFHLIINFILLLLFSKISVANIVQKKEKLEKAKRMKFLKVPDIDSK